METKQSDHEKLELIFLKLGLAETDDQLQHVVCKYLTLILAMLTNTNSDIRTKILELLAHLNKRLASRRSVQLPVEQLFIQLNTPSLSSFVTNFTIIYIKTGYPRLTMDKRIQLAPMLFKSMQAKSKTQQDILLRLMVEMLPCIKLDKSLEENRQLFEFTSRVKETSLFLEFCLDVLLMPYSLRLNDVVALANSANPSSDMPSGLSHNAIRQLLGDANTSAWTLEEIEKIKIGILKLIKADLFDVNAVVCHLIIASSDTRHAVATTADLELRKFVSVINWNEPTLCMQLYRLYLGHMAVYTKKQAADDKREPANIRIKLKLVQNLTRSKLAGECFPQCIQVVYDGLFGKTNTKLITLILHFIHYIFDKCSSVPGFRKQASMFLNALIKISQNLDLNDIVRGLAYIGMGKLSKTLPELFNQKVDLIQDLFSALSKENSTELKMSIQEAISMISFAYKGVADNRLLLMDSLIESSLAGTDHQLRMAGVRYAGTIFPSNHIPSRYQLLLAVGDVKEDISSQASRFLAGNKNHDETTEDEPLDLPSFSSMLTFVDQKATQRLSSGKGYVFGNKSIAFVSAAYQAILLYLKNCLFKEAEKNASFDSAIDKAVLRMYIRHLLTTDENETIHLLALYIDLMLQYVQTIPDPVIVSLLLEIIASCPRTVPLEKLLAKHSIDNNSSFMLKLKWIKGLTKYVNDEVRMYSAELYAILFQRHSPSVHHYHELTEELLRDYCSKQYEVKHSSVLLLGYVVGDYLKLFNLNMDTTQTSMETDCMLQNITAILQLLADIVKDEGDQLLCSTACSAIGEIARKVPLPLADGSATKLDKQQETDTAIGCSKLLIVKCLLSRLTNSSPHIVREQAVMALGRLPVGSVSFPHTRLILDELLKSAEIKDTELHFTVGSALCSASLGPNSPESCNKWTGLCEHNLTDLIGKDRVEWLLSTILKEYVVNRVPAVRQASCIWLMVMLKTASCAEHQYVRKNLLQLQNAFHSLLSEPNELTQDIASKGFGIVYELADEHQKKVLVDQLVDSLTGTSNTPASKVRIIGQEGSTLFQGASAFGKAPDGSSLSTYKELCSLASDLNQPDLVYKFLHLANHHAVWNTKKGVAFGFRNIAAAAQEQLKPHLPFIVPRLYRYTFDPQPSIRAAMTSIWNVVAKDSLNLLETYMSSILDDLTANLTNNLWRTRQASCLALVDLLRSGIRQTSKPYEDDSAPTVTQADVVVNKLPELWSLMFRVRDDIKESVRNAADDTCKTLKKITIRLCTEGRVDHNYDEKIANIVEILLREGLNNSVEEVRNISLSTLVEISKVSGKLIKPCISRMIVALIEALSSTESQVINYLHNRSGETTQSALDWVRAESVKSNPLMETALRCIEQCDADLLADVVPALTDLTKRGIGILTKAGCVHAIEKLVSVCRDGVTPYAGKLISALVSGLGDRSLVVRKIISTGIGHLAQVAKNATLEKTLRKLKKWYTEGDDETLQHASGNVMYAIAQKCPDTLNQHATLILPLAFYGMHEDVLNSNVSSSNVNASDEADLWMSGKDMWHSIWNEFTTRFETAIRLYLGEIVILLCPCLQSSNWRCKIQAAAAISTMAKKQSPGTIVDVHLEHLIQALLDALKGRTWNGKEHLLTALCDIGVHCYDNLTRKDSDKMVTALFKECKRENLLYRTEALSALARVLQTHQLDRFSEFWEIAQPYLHDQDKIGSDNEDEISGNSNTTTEWKIREKILKSLGRAWPSKSKITQVKYYEDVFMVVTKFVSRSTYSVQLTSLTSLGLILKSLEREKVDVENMVKTNTSDCFEKVCDIILDPLCVCLGNMKFVSICEEALNVCEILMEMLKDGTCARCDVTLQKLRESLQGSSLNSKKSQHYHRIEKLLRDIDELK